MFFKNSVANVIYKNIVTKDIGRVKLSLNLSKILKNVSTYKNLEDKFFGLFTETYDLNKIGLVFNFKFLNSYFVNFYVTGFEKFIPCDIDRSSLRESLTDDYKMYFYYQNNKELSNIYCSEVEKMLRYTKEFDKSQKSFEEHSNEFIYSIVYRDFNTNIRSKSKIIQFNLSLSSGYDIYIKRIYNSNVYIGSFTYFFGIVFSYMPKMTLTKDSREYSDVTKEITDTGKRTYINQYVEYSRKILEANFKLNQINNLVNFIFNVNKDCIFDNYLDILSKKIRTEEINHIFSISKVLIPNINLNARNIEETKNPSSNFENAVYGVYTKIPQDQIHQSKISKDSLHYIMPKEAYFKIESLIKSLKQLKENNCLYFQKIFLDCNIQDFEVLDNFLSTKKQVNRITLNTDTRKNGFNVDFEYFILEKNQLAEYHLLLVNNVKDYSKVLFKIYFDDYFQNNIIPKDFNNKKNLLLDVLNKSIDLIFLNRSYQEYSDYYINFQYLYKDAFGGGNQKLDWFINRVRIPKPKSSSIGLPSGNRNFCSTRVRSGQVHSEQEETYKLYISSFEDIININKSPIKMQVGNLGNDIAQLISMYFKNYEKIVIELKNQPATLTSEQIENLKFQKERLDFYMKMYKEIFLIDSVMKYDLKNQDLIKSIVSEENIKWFDDILIKNKLSEIHQQCNGLYSDFHPNHTTSTIDVINNSRMSAYKIETPLLIGFGWRYQIIDYKINFNIDIIDISEKINKKNFNIRSCFKIFNFLEFNLVENLRYILKKNFLF